MHGITSKTYKKICAQWAKTIILLSESEMDIWPPLSGAYTFVRSFLDDTKLQQELFGNLHPSLALIDGHDLESISFEEFEKQFLSFVGAENTSVDAYLSQNSRLFGFFVVGFDTALKHNHTETLKQIGTLLEKHSHLSLIFITELPIPESSLFSDLVSKHMLVANIYYQPIFSTEDSLSYLSYLQESWKYTLQGGLERLFAENIGGHMMLLKEAARIARENPTFTIKQILAQPTLTRKALAIFHLLSKSDQKLIHSFLFSPSESLKLSEYLTKTELIKDGKVGLQYWLYLVHNVLHEEDFEAKHEISVLHQLTQTEQKILDALKNSNELVSRDTVSKLIWGEEWELRYSDWALGQIMHRLREKLEKAKLPYAIETKKGEGFYLEEKQN